MKRVVVAAMLLIGLVSNAQAQNDASAAKKEQAALHACEKIEKNALWGAELAQTLEKQAVLLKDRDFVTPPVFKLLSYSQSAFDDSVADAAQKSNGTSKELIAYMVRQRALRSLLSCGAVLYQGGKIVIPGAPDTQERLFAKINNCVVENENRLNQVNSDTRLYNAQKEERVLTGEACRETFAVSGRDGVIFPLHLLIKGGEEKFAGLTGSNEYKAWAQRVDSDVVEATQRMAARAVADEQSAKERGVREAQKKKDRDDKTQRIAEVRKGNLKAARTCGEVAEGALPGQEIVSNMLGYPISRDAQAVYPAPTGLTYASLGRLISYGPQQATTADINQVSGQKYAYVLKFSNKTLLFKDKVSIGANMYFVGRYMGNASVPVRQGANTLDVPARVYDVVCASGI